MKTEVIKPKKEKKERKSILTPIIYVILGLILAFKSNEAVQLVFYVLGALVILYGIKSLFTYYQNRENVQYKNINLTVGFASVILGVLLIVLSGVLEASIRYVLGFFLIYIGFSRLLTNISFHNYKSLAFLSSILLIVFGIFSIFVSNAVLVIIGWLLIINAVILFWDYLKN